MERVKELFNKIKNGLSWFFGNSPDLQVTHENNEDAIAATEGMSTEEKRLLNEALKTARLNGETFRKRIEKDVQVLPVEKVEKVETPRVMGREEVSHGARNKDGRSLDD